MLADSTDLLNALSQLAIPHLLVIAGSIGFFFGQAKRFRNWFSLSPVAGKRVSLIALILLGLGITGSAVVYVQQQPAVRDWIPKYIFPIASTLVAIGGLLCIGRYLRRTMRGIHTLARSHRNPQNLIGQSEARRSLEALGSSLAEKGEQSLAHLNDNLYSHTSTNISALAKGVQDAQHRLIQRVEDATRSIYPGFGAIFAKAYELIQEAERELWFVNFTPYFGDIHRNVRSIAIDYATRTKGRDISKDVDTFMTAFKTRISDVHMVRVLTLWCDVEWYREAGVGDKRRRDQIPAMEKFIGPIVENREEYRKLVNADAVLDNMRRAKAEIATIADARGEELGNFDYYEATSLPIQLLIAGLPGKGGQGEDRFGCLTFMVGAEMLPGIETGEEAGIYTEVNRVVQVYKKVAGALIKGAHRSFYRRGKTME